MPPVTTDSQEEGSGRPLLAQVDALNRRCEEVASAIESSPDSQLALESATVLADMLREVAEGAAELRARMAERIWAEERLSLAALGERLSVSRARAGQLLQVAKRSREKKEKDSDNG